MLRVIYNPVAGPKVAGKMARVEACLSGMGIPFEILKTSGPRDATILAREAALSGADVVVAVGGDGTINEAANGLAGSATKLAIVPHGTGNVFADEIGLPEKAEDCLALLREGKTIDIPLARADGRYFVLMASAGFDAEVLERMETRNKRCLGITAYYLAGMRHLLRAQPTLWMEFPGRERVEAQSVIVCRGRKYGGGVTMAPAGNLSAKSFQVVALLKAGRLSIVRFAIAALRGKHAGSPSVQIREATALLVRCRIPSASQVDGEYLGPLPVRFEMTDVTLKVVVPKDFPFPS